MISAARLLQAWDRGQAAASVPARALALLSLVDSDEDPLLLTVGEANTRLLELRGELFGAQLTCVADCPGCGDRLELGFTVGDLLATAAAPPPELSISAGGQDLRFRLPTWVDLAAIAAMTGRGDPRIALLQRCLLEPEVEGVGEKETFTETLQDAVAAAMEEADPLAETLIAIGCAQCDGQFEARFDIVEYLWAEVDLRSRRLLGEVHALASAYGWREADVLALSPARRRVYLEMAVGK